MGWDMGMWACVEMVFAVEGASGGGGPSNTYQPETTLLPEVSYREWDPSPMPVPQVAAGRAGSPENSAV